jgi:molecular chaperone GrpE
VSDETVMEERIESNNEPVAETLAEPNVEAVAEPAAEVEHVEDEVAPDGVAKEEPLSLEEQLVAAQAEAAKNLDGWMRAQAEFANARKRMERQRAEIYVNATTDIATKLIPVLDDFARALDNVPAEIAESSWFEGVQLVQRKLITILEGMNVTPIEAVGQPFDPKYHEALSQEESDEFESGVVTRELQKGYKVGDRVIRPALVYVAE